MKVNWCGTIIKMTKTNTSRIKIYISSEGRKRKYIGMEGERSAYPVVYFRKSKWASKEDFETIVKHILDNL